MRRRAQARQLFAEAIVLMNGTGTVHLAEDRDRLARSFVEGHTRAPLRLRNLSIEPGVSLSP